MGRETVAGGPERVEARPGLLPPGARIPNLALPSAPDGRPVRLRDGGRDASVLVFLRSAETQEARDYLRALAGTVPVLRRWDARAIAILPTGLGPATRLARDLHPPFPVLADEDDVARRRCGVARDAAALLIADRWGQLYHSVSAPSETRLPLPGAEGIIMQWFRYIATQCPECGVPDEPGRGEWAQ